MFEGKLRKQNAFDLIAACCKKTVGLFFSRTQCPNSKTSRLCTKAVQSQPSLLFDVCTGAVTRNFSLALCSKMGPADTIQNRTEVHFWIFPFLPFDFSMPKNLEVLVLEKIYYKFILDIVLLIDRLLTFWPSKTTKLESNLQIYILKGCTN